MTAVEPFGSGHIESPDFGRWYNPSPGYPFLHQDAMGYTITAVPAAGYAFDGWQQWSRWSNSPDDFFLWCIPLQIEKIGVNLVRMSDGVKIKAPLTYLVGHFKKISDQPHVEPGLPVVATGDAVEVPPPEAKWKEEWTITLKAILKHVEREGK